MTQPKFHYMATLPDGTVPPTSASTAPYTLVNLTEHVGQVLDHPTPGRPWYDEGPFSYFRTYTQRGVGEVLERVGAWPARLWVVEPLGETGNWAPKEYPYWVLCHQLRVVEETDAWRALGPRGEQVLGFIDQQLPERAAAWAAAYEADPQGTVARHRQWYEDSLRNGAPCQSGRGAWWWVQQKARSCRREAALEAAKNAVVAGTAKALSGSGVSAGAIEYATDRAFAHTAAIQFQDRLRRNVLDALRGEVLDTAARPAA